MEPVLRPFSVGPDPYAGRPAPRRRHRGRARPRRTRTGRRDGLVRRRRARQRPRGHDHDRRRLRRDAAPARRDERGAAATPSAEGPRWASSARAATPSPCSRTSTWAFASPPTENGYLDPLGLLPARQPAPPPPPSLPEPPVAAPPPAVTAEIPSPQPTPAEPAVCEPVEEPAPPALPGCASE